MALTAVRMPYSEDTHLLCRELREQVVAALEGAGVPSLAKKFEAETARARSAAVFAAAGRLVSLGALSAEQVHDDLGSMAMGMDGDLIAAAVATWEAEEEEQRQAEEAARHKPLYLLLEGGSKTAAEHPQPQMLSSQEKVAGLLFFANTGRYGQEITDFVRACAPHDEEFCLAALGLSDVRPNQRSLHGMPWRWLLPQGISPATRQRLGEKHPEALLNDVEMTEERRLEMIRKQPKWIEAVKNPSEALCLAAMEASKGDVFDELPWRNEACWKAALELPKASVSDLLWRFSKHPEEVTELDRHHLLHWAMDHLRSGGRSGDSGEELLARLWAGRRPTAALLGVVLPLADARRDKDGTLPYEVCMTLRAIGVAERTCLEPLPAELRALYVRECPRAALGLPDLQRAELEAILEHKPGFLEYVEEQDEALCLMVLEKVPQHLRYCRVRTEAVLVAGISGAPEQFSHIDKAERSEAVCLAAVRKSGYLINECPVQTPQVIETAVRQAPGAICYVQNPSAELRRMAIQAYPAVIKNLPKPTAAEWRAAIAADPELLKQFKTPSMPLLRLALRSELNASTILQLELPWRTPETVVEIWKFATGGQYGAKGYAALHCESLTEAARQLLRDMTYSETLEVLGQAGGLLEAVRMAKDEAMCLAAVRNDPRAILACPKAFRRSFDAALEKLCVPKAKEAGDAAAH